MASKEVYSLKDGVLTVSLHPGQYAGLVSVARIILILAGSQGGKTSFGPIWFFEEIKRCGPGDYAVVAPTFDLMEKKCLPELLRYFDETLKLGRYKQGPIRKFVFSKEGMMKAFGSTEGQCTIYFGYGENSDSLESATYKAVWCDEAGQRKFKLDSWDALQRRLTIHQGRVLVTTTPYEFGWLKTRLHDRAGAVTYYDESLGQMVTDEMPGDPEIHVVRFASTLNPAFPLSEFERQRSVLPKWKFQMMFQAMFTKPAGTIYDCFIDRLWNDPKEPGHLVRPFKIPDDWVRVMGLDFGQMNTAAAFFALHPDGEHIFLYKTYHAGGKSAGQHVEALLKREPGMPNAYGGAPSEDDWRDKFSKGGLYVQRPVISDVEVGIDAVYEALKHRKLLIFNNLEKVILDLLNYSRTLDNNQEPTENIEDKHSYHRLDAVRYGCVEIMRGGFTGPQVMLSKQSQEVP